MPFDKFPYTNFHELNLDYFIQHFKQIFAEWAELYQTMLAWKEQTMQDLEAWKTETGEDIEAWEQEVLDNLDVWKTAFQELFDETFSNLEDIKDAAEDARDAAEGFADDAQGYAEDAEQTAQELSDLADNAFVRLTATQAATIAASSNTEKLSAMPTGTYYDWSASELSALVSEDFPLEFPATTGWYLVKCYPAPYSTKVVTVTNRTGAQLCYGYTLTTHPDTFTWYDRSWQNEADAITEITAEISAIEDNAFRKLTSTEASAVSDLLDMPTGTYYTWYGTALSTMVGSGFPATLVSSSAYRVKCYPYTSPYKAYTIERTSGSELYYGATSLNSPNAIAWWDRSYAGLDARIQETETATSAVADITPVYNGSFLTWAIGKLIQPSNGTITDNSYHSVSDPLPVSPGMVFTNLTPDTDGTGAGSVVYSALYYDDGETVSFISNSKTRLYAGDVLTIPDNVNIVRFQYGHATASGVTITKDMPAQYFSVSIALPAKQAQSLIDPTTPLYVAIGASTTYGAVHHMDGAPYTQTKYQFPLYAGNALGLRAVNLGAGGTGVMQRTSYNLKNYMDIVYTSDSLLSKAKLITITLAFGNDSGVSGFTVGNYTDYYPYDAEVTEGGTTISYHPSGTAGMATMVSLGATWCGCVNWLIKWISDHYPRAQLVLLFGGFSTNMSKTAVLDDTHLDANGEPTKLIFNNTINPETGSGLAHEKLKDIVEALGMPLIDFFEYQPYNYYSAYAKDADGKYALFSTTGDSDDPTTWEINTHPSDDGYLLMARYITGKITELFNR